ncbi:MAG: ABC transporter ATP-binding protein [Anaerovoracaceae bacterium]
MLEFKNVSFKYGEDDYTLIKDLSFNIKQGEFVSIIGASGCGKSTVFRLINGLEQIDGGEISYEGQNVADQKSFSAYMPQSDLLFPWRTIGKNISLPMEIKGVDKTLIKKRCKETLAEVGLAEYIDKYPRELSGGMKQRVSFARTLLTDSELFLLDEPFSALDSLTRISMQEWLLDQWKKFNKTVLFVTHDVEEAIFLSKKILLIRELPVTKFEEYEIPLSYPRNREDLKKPEIIDLKEELIQKLKQEVAL